MQEEKDKSTSPNNVTKTLNTSFGISLYDKLLFKIS